VSWTKLLSDNRVTREPSSKQELDNLRSIVSLRLSDTNAQGLSDEQRFIIAYDAARTSSMMIIRAAGYRPKKLGGHYNTFIALEAADPAFTQLAAYFNTCRMKRNESEYDFAGAITSVEADELVRIARQFASDAQAWILKNHPNLA
jgi:hypothetical protein